MLSEFEKEKGGFNSAREEVGGMEAKFDLMVAAWKAKVNAIPPGRLTPSGAVALRR